MPYMCVCLICAYALYVRMPYMCVCLIRVYALYVCAIGDTARNSASEA